MKAKALVSINAIKGSVIGFSDPKIHRIVFEDEFGKEDEIIEAKRKELKIDDPWYAYGSFVGLIPFDM